MTVNSLGVLVDLEGGPDSPQPADEESGEDPLHDTDDDGGGSVGLVLGEEASDDGAGTGAEDAEDEHDKAVGLLELDSADLLVHFHFDEEFCF